MIVLKQKWVQERHIVDVFDAVCKTLKVASEDIYKWKEAKDLAKKVDQLMANRLEYTD